VGADLAIAGTIAAEFAPQKSRGPLLVVLVTMFSVGAAIAYTVGYFMLNLGPDAWRWMLASSAIPALLILTMRLGTPESPRWLLSNGRAEEAEAVLKQMLGPDATLADIEEPEDSPKGYMTIFRPEFRRRTLFVALFWACQLVPIYAIATYEPAILKQFGLAEGNTAYLGAVIIQIFYVFGSLSGALFINRGRRKLLLWSFAISALLCSDSRSSRIRRCGSCSCCSVSSASRCTRGNAWRRSTRPNYFRPAFAQLRTDSPRAQAESVRRSACMAPRTCSTTRCSRIQRGLPTVDGADGEVGGGR